VGALRAPPGGVRSTCTPFTCSPGFDTLGIDKEDGVARNYDLYHSMELRDNLWYCVDENILADYCEDETRCDYGCYCNNKDDDGNG
jgi:hypothetical protein